MSHRFRPGVASGDDVQEILDHANQNEYALPAVNVVGTNTVNAVLEAAKEVNSPVIIQFSNGGAVFYAGKSLPNDGEHCAVAGAVSGAHHVHFMAEAYGVPVILHTDHAARKLLPWVDGMLDAGEKHYEATGRSLYSSHMLDLSEEPVSDNLATCKEYFERMNRIDMTIEIELGVTGGEEDGVLRRATDVQASDDPDHLVALSDRGGALAARAVPFESLGAPPCRDTGRHAPRLSPIHTDER